MAYFNHSLKFSVKKEEKKNHIQDERDEEK